MQEIYLYYESSITKQHIVNGNAKMFNQDSEMLDVAMDYFNEGMVPQSAWDSLAPNTQQDEGIARCTDYTTL